MISLAERAAEPDTGSIDVSEAEKEMPKSIE
jgi:hypothetical protein